MQIGIVVPCYNEEEVLSETSKRLLELLERLSSKGKISSESRIYFVDDGSKDGTWALIESLCQRDNRFMGIKLSSNRGHQNALLAGLLTAEGDALISIDADLQDDVDAIEEMVDNCWQGSDIVYGVRKKRDTDSFFKRFTAQTFYKMMSLLGVESLYNHADYRLMTRKAIEGLRQFSEVNLFLRGIVPLIGFESTIVYYDRAKRFAGESKYPFRKMLALALDAITSFSVIPLRIIMFIGFLVFGGSMLITLWVLWTRFVTDRAIPGWASTVLPMYFLGGIQVFCVGILGEYLGKTYAEVKDRPRFVIEKISGKSGPRRIDFQNSSFKSS